MKLFQLRCQILFAPAKKKPSSKFEATVSKRKKLKNHKSFNY